ncbi:hypothetical protein NFI96_027817 [Prochilodus magdalenae]|nr:hypothetical protein NFI96_027817 [Prochilodus magdalenae]
MIMPSVVKPLLSIINSSLSLGHLPRSLKLAVVKPLIKNLSSIPMSSLTTDQSPISPFIKDLRKSGIATTLLLPT